MVRLLTVTFLALACHLDLFADASLQHQHDARPRNLEMHRRLVQQRAPALHSPESIAKLRRGTKKSGKRCRAVESTSSQAVSTKASETKATETPKATPESSSPSSSNSSGGSSNGGANGLINVKSSCGNIGATENITPTSGPNGDIDWLNCGITDGGWRPPFVQVSDIVTVDLPTAVKQSNSPFKACSAYIGIFEKYASQYGIPSIILASFAMQESSCNPETVGGGGEQGLMQITKDKCGGAPGGNCRDPDFNIGAGAKYFAQTLESNAGNLLLTIGTYNGWFSGMTYGQATAARYSACCLCQNNLDYLQQFLNGWVLNVDSYTRNPKLGKYFNLDVCH